MEKHYEIDYLIRINKTALNSIETTNNSLHRKTYVRLLKMIRKNGGSTIQIPFSTLISDIAQAKERSKTPSNNFYHEIFGRMINGIQNKYEMIDGVDADQRKRLLERSPTALEVSGGLGQGLTMTITPDTKREIIFSSQGVLTPGFQISYDGQEIGDVSTFDTFRAINFVADMMDLSLQSE